MKINGKKGKTIRKNRSQVEKNGEIIGVVQKGMVSVHFGAGGQIDTGGTFC